MTQRVLLGLATAVLSAALAGCQQPKPTEGAVLPPEPDYTRPLPPGASALRLITDPARLPDLRAAYATYDATLLRAIDASVVFFAAPSSRRSFPFEGITHAQAYASVLAMRELLRGDPTPEAFELEVLRRFDVYESVGYNGAGTVLFTGYFSPEFPASLRRTTRFGAPLYRRPSALVTDPMTGTPQGWTTGGRVGASPTRGQFETSGVLDGTELVWLEDALSAYLVHVNGSAKLRLRDGRVMYVGYDGKTEHEYASLGRAMVEAGLLGKNELSLPAIRRVYRAKPAAVEALMLRNDCFVFFREYPGDAWPAGSLGVPVTSERSLATDKRIYPRGGVVLVDTDAVTFSESTRPFFRLMLDQDTGGAIRAPGRADLFMGIGPTAEILAGGQYAEGRLYYFLLKPGYVEHYPVE